MFGNIGVIDRGLTEVGIDVYARQVFLGILIIIAVAVTFERRKIAITEQEAYALNSGR